MKCLAALFSVIINSLNLFILKQSLVLASFVNFHKILVNNSAGTNVKVTYL